MATIDLNSFFSAARSGDISMLEDCLANGIDIHSCNDLALRSARDNSQTEAVIFLIQNGANINALDDADLRSSSFDGRTQTVKRLLAKGTCSHEAKVYATFNAILCGHEDIVRLLKDEVSPTANDGAILKVLKLCEHEKVIALFEDYLK